MNGQIKAEIEELSELILEQTRKLIAYDLGAPQIEVDITKESIRKLYDKIDLLVDTNWKASTTQKLEEAIDDQVDELLNAAAAQFEGNLEQIEQQILEQEEIIEEQAELQEEDIEVSDENLEIEVKTKNPIKDNDSIFTNEEDKLQTKESIVGVEEVVDEIIFSEEKVSESTPEVKIDSTVEESKIVGDHLNKKSISNLKSAIGINDKFQFINELFDGSMKTFNQAITQLEGASDLKVATDMFNEIASKHNWDEESQAYLQLLDYVNRRF